MFNLQFRSNQFFYFIFKSVVSHWLLQKFHFISFFTKLRHLLSGIVIKIFVNHSRADFAIWGYFIFVVAVHWTGPIGTLLCLTVLYFGLCVRVWQMANWNELARWIFMRAEFAKKLARGKSKVTEPTYRIKPKEAVWRPSVRVHTDGSHSLQCDCVY